jgi:hypothetical protein
MFNLANSFIITNKGRRHNVEEMFHLFSFLLLPTLQRWRDRHAKLAVSRFVLLTGAELELE